MSSELILRNISKHIELDEHEVEVFLSLVKRKSIPKKTILLNAGESCKYLNYVDSGALRSYCIDKDGKEATVMFAVADWWVTDMYCYLNSKPAMMYIEALEDSCIYQLSRENLEKLFRTIPKFERFFRILMQNAYTREQLRVIENLTLPAEDRYDNFMKKYPQAAETVTQKQIASYLGITPEHLSAIRKNKNKTAS
ncbi:Crp/Fnr family transcriptional regulator [Mucilaginibacter sp. RS28]|uniref:Crp/Fnr family transcriptional regulator n=1 Tax=Mucilaginibacter straminoryzae TaxID=2932774 RepID=A0A9X2BEY7_9SPHI|nr:Crp/Fnr family transcriptional regulator [Mucilaginibacter straminoryzae]MCJ8211923.1 Crp/Fnr family transcriptional regulator [Mucilaginibacter straminoryzae]